MSMEGPYLNVLKTALAAGSASCIAPTLPLLYRSSILMLGEIYDDHRDAKEKEITFTGK